MARPNWEYIRVDVRLARHPKLDGARSSTKWTLIELWLHCGEHLTDGYVRRSVWLAIGTANARTDLVKRGLAKRVRGGYQMHDYLDWNRSKAEVEELIAHRRDAGSKGGKAKASATASATALAKQVLKQTASKPLAEAEAEAEAEADQSMADVVDRSNGSRPDLTDLIIKELRTATGETVDREWATRTQNFILSGRRVTDPAAYVRQVIRTEPDPRTRFLPLY